MDIKKEPPYKEAVERIVQKFEESGYGIIITDEEFDRFLSIDKPEGEMSYSSFRGLELERLQRYKAIESLLVDHNLCLVRSKAVLGFELLPPREQLNDAVKRRMGKVRTDLQKVHSLLININHSLLSVEEEQDRQRKLTRMGFVKCALNKRKIELPQAKSPKELKE